jgi:hypothetical protein
VTKMSSMVVSTPGMEGNLKSMVALCAPKAMSPVLLLLMGKSMKAAHKPDVV